MPDPRRWRMLPVILTATFMGLFDFFVVNVAAPSLTHDLGASESQLELIVGGYAFCYAAGLVTGGRLGDLFSYRRMFLAGMAAFTVASVLCGIAQTPGQLVAFRLLQGLTAAAMVPQVLALITAVFPDDERGRAIAWFSVAVAIGSVAGQILGGLLLHADLFGLGWRAVFLVNLPVGLVAIPLAWRLLPPLRAAGRPRFDPLGAVGLAVALGLALAPLVLGRSQGWPAWTFVLLALSVPALAGVVHYERRLSARGGLPVLDLSLFRQRQFVVGLVINMLCMGYFSSFMLGLTLYLQSGLHQSPLAAGLTFGPMGIVFGAISIPGQRLVARFGHRVITAGALVSVVALVVLAVLLNTVEVGPAWLMIPMILSAIGNGLVFPALVGSVLARVKPQQAGSAAGILTTVQQFAIATGVAALGTLFFSIVGAHPGRTDFDHALTAVVLAGLTMVAAMALLSPLLSPRRAPAAVLVPVPT